MISKASRLAILVIVSALFTVLFANVEQTAAAQARDKFEPADCWFEKPVPFLPGPEFTCGYVTVPERHENPDGPTIQIPVAISTAASENAKPDPLFLAQGGPGGDAFEVFPILLGTSNVWMDRDIVIFNQRGTRYARPDLSCTESFDGAADLLALPPEEADARSLELLQACYDRLTAEGIDLSAFNSLENAADVEALRRILGYDEYNFYGVSYGTLLGLHLLNNQHEGLRTVILDGVVPTNLNFIPKVTENMDRVFSEIIQTCERDPACSDQYPDLEKRFFDLVESLNEEPQYVRLSDSETGQTVRARLDGDTLVSVMFQAFYLPDSYAYFPKLVDNLEKGDMTFIEGIWPLFAFDRTLSEGMYFSVICAEDADFEPSEMQLDTVRPYFAETAQEELDSYTDACAIWAVDQLPAEVDDAVISSTPVLLLSGHYDPITPPYFAEVAAEGLENSRLFVDPLGSHGVAFGLGCASGIVQQFLDSPGETPDGSCLTASEPKAFAPADALSFPLVGEINQLSDTIWWQFGLSALFLLIVLSAFLVLPVAWLISVLSSKERPPEDPTGKHLRWLAGALILCFGLLALVFVAGATYYTFDSLATGLATLFAISGGAAPFFIIPLLLLVMSLVMLVIAVIAWRRGYWRTWARVYFTILVGAAFAYVLVLAYGGMLFVLL